MLLPEERPWLDMLPGFELEFALCGGSCWWCSELGPGPEKFPDCMPWRACGWDVAPADMAGMGRGGSCGAAWLA